MGCGNVNMNISCLPLPTQKHTRHEKSLFVFLLSSILMSSRMASLLQKTGMFPSQMMGHFLQITKGQKHNSDRIQDEIIVEGMPGRTMTVSWNCIYDPPIITSNLRKPQQILWT